MGLEFKVKSKKEWAPMRETILSEIKDHSNFLKEYDYKNKHWYDFKIKKDNSDWPDIGLIVEDDGLYILRHDLKDAFLYLDNIKAKLNELGGYEIEEL